ncbi:MAG: redox-regulated ATPase YchF [Candidatus Omnitrophica bacterium]|nr:redox-regulated ATPase YchF [Candidatus Omnitrophota bacterium]
MSAKLGLVGLPNVGKSTLFNALTRGHAPVAPYPFTTTDRNVGVAPVDDARLTRLAALIPHDQLIPTSLEFVDIAGLVQGAHQGEGLGNQFLSHVFAVDALLHVVRCFEDPNLPHVMNSVEPLRDVDVINTELLLKDLEIVERRLQKEQKLAKSGDQHARALVETLEQCRQALGQGTPVRRMPDPAPNGLELLTRKPVIYAANVDEASLDAPPPAAQQLARRAQDEQAQFVVVCAKLEAELAELDEADRVAMMRELGVKESALPLVVRSGYALLNLITFFTTISRIIQAWTVTRGAKAPQAAGVIHTDFERQFIRAEVISVDAFVRCGGEAQARSQGLLRVEGKDYVVQDGDVIHFRISQ